MDKVRNERKCQQNRVFWNLNLLLYYKANKLKGACLGLCGAAICLYLGAKRTDMSLLHGKSERVVDILEVDGALRVSEARQCAVGRNVQSEAVASNAVEFFHNLPRQGVETLGADIFIAASREDEVLSWHEADRVDNWVHDFAGLGHVPDHLLNGSVQVAEVPHLDALSEGAASRDNIIVVS